jgi:hypothetical protein
VDENATLAVDLVDVNDNGRAHVRGAVHARYVNDHVKQRGEWRV